MDVNRPKRRKDIYNPYTICETNQGDCYISFIDGAGVQQRIKVNRDLYCLFDTFELEDISYMNVIDRHIERSEQTEESMNTRAIVKPVDVESSVLDNLLGEALHKAIKSLPEVQQRRIKLYYFSGLTYEKIAEMEGCTIMPVKRSIDAAIKK